MSTNRSLCSASRIACCSSALRARGCSRSRCGIGAGRSGAGLTPVAPVVAGLRRADGDARPARRSPGEFGDGLVGHGVDLGWCPRSRRASPRARAVLPAHPPRSGLGQLLLQLALLASRRAIFSACGSRRLRPRGTANPASAPASRALRHSDDMAGVQALPAQQRPLRPSGAASYSAKISNLYSP